MYNICIKRYRNIKRGEKMKQIYLVLALMFLVGCSSIEVSQKYNNKTNFAKIKTFQLLPTKSQAAKNIPLVNKNIKLAIQREFDYNKNFKLKKNNADAYIAYHLINKGRDTSNPPATLVQKEDASGFLLDSGDGRMSFNEQPSENFYQKNIFIQILNKQRKVIWQGMGSTPAKNHPTRKETTMLISETVKKILRQYPPK